MMPYRIFHRQDVTGEVFFSEVCDSLPSARAAVLEISKYYTGPEDNEVLLVDDEDELLVVDVDGALVLAFKNGAFVDVGSISSFELPEPRFLGVDVCKNGRTIFGTSDDPWGLKANDLVHSGAAQEVKIWVEENPGYQVVMRFQGDIREGTVYHILPSPERESIRKM